MDGPLQRGDAPRPAHGAWRDESLRFVAAGVTVPVPRDPSSRRASFTDRDGAASTSFAARPLSRISSAPSVGGNSMQPRHSVQRRASGSLLEVRRFKQRPLWERLWLALCVLFDYVTGRYMATTFFVSLEAIREAYDLVGLVAALLLGAALQVSFAPWLAEGHARKSVETLFHIFTFCRCSWRPRRTCRRGRRGPATWSSRGSPAAG